MAAETQGLCDRLGLGGGGCRARCGAGKAGPQGDLSEQRPLVMNAASFTDRTGRSSGPPPPAPAGLGADLMAMGTQGGETSPKASRASNSNPALRCGADPAPGASVSPA